MPRGTHTYFVDRMLDCWISHVRTDILGRYIKFFSSLRESPSMEVSVLAHIVARDVRTTTGSIHHSVQEMTGLDPWSSLGIQVIKVIREKLADLPEQDNEALPAVVNMNATALLPEAGIDLKEYLTGLEQDLIQQALDDSGGVVARAAERLTIRRTTLVEKMRKYGLQRA